MIYRYDPKKKYFLVSLKLENKPGALGNIGDLLAIRGINILEGFFGGISNGSKGTMGFFLETTNQKMDEAWLKDLLQGSVMVSDVEVRSGVEGFLADSVNFPLTWNTGERAVLMRMSTLRAMLDAVRESDPKHGPAALYKQGFDFGYTGWENLLDLHRPKTREGLAEMLNIHVAAGWGHLELTDLDVPAKRAWLRMDDGFECADVSANSPVGFFTSGHLAGVMSAYFGVKMRSTESKCTSVGDEHCEFYIEPEPKTD